MHGYHCRLAIPLAYDAALGEPPASAHSRAIVGNDAPMLSALRASNSTTVGGSSLCDASSSTFELLRQGLHNGPDWQEWLTDRGSGYTSIDRSNSEVPGRTASVDAIDEPPSVTDSLPSLGYRASLLDGGNTDESSNNNPNKAPRTGATAGGHGCQDEQTLVGRCEDAGEPHNTFANGTKTVDNRPRIADKTGANGTGTTSLAPGWKQTASWTTAGAGVWVGGCMFALAWTILLC